jgi:hypothetical protein
MCPLFAFSGGLGICFGIGQNRCAKPIGGCSIGARNQVAVSVNGAWAQCVVVALLQAAAAGDVRAAGLVLERTEGKVKGSLQVEAPQTVIFRWATDEDDLRENRSIKEPDEQ